MTRRQRVPFNVKPGASGSADAPHHVAKGQPLVLSVENTDALGGSKISSAELSR